LVLPKAWRCLPCGQTRWLARNKQKGTTVKNTWIYERCGNTYSVGYYDEHDRWIHVSDCEDATEAASCVLALNFNGIVAGEETMEEIELLLA